MRQLCSGKVYRKEVGFRGEGRGWGEAPELLQGTGQLGSRISAVKISQGLCLSRMTDKVFIEGLWPMDGNTSGQLQWSSGGLGPGHVTQGPKQVLKGTIMACPKHSRSKDISAPWQVATNLSPERKPILPEWPLAFPCPAMEASESPHLPSNHQSALPGAPQGTHTALAGGEMWLIMQPFLPALGSGHSWTWQHNPCPRMGAKECQGWGACPRGSRCDLQHQVRTRLKRPW